MCKYTFFWQNRSPFSNWYPSKFTWNGIEFTRGEQYMMFRKAIMFSDESSAVKIMATDNPKLQKDLGRQVTDYSDSEWASHRVEIMIEGLYEKFSQNSKLRQALIDTGDTILVEASPYDRIWGIGMSVDHPNILDESKWQGQNLLGIVLMQVRAMILK